jgi:hypothetical protein
VSRRAGLIVCALLLALFGTLSYASVLTKSATFDEPVQVVAGWLRLHHQDFRLDFEDPPLWEDWASLPNGPSALKPDFQAQDWRGMPQRPALEWSFATHALYGTPGVDGVAVVNRSRAMMLLVGLLLGALVALWAWRLAGPIAACFAVGLFAFDPNLLAHAPLVKNDISMGVVMISVAYLLWRIGQRVTARNALGLALACAIAANIKFSAVLLPPIVLLLLALRVIAARPWPVLGRSVESPGGRLAVAGGLLAAMAVLTYIAVWTAYGFRFGATPDPQLGIQLEPMLDALRNNQLTARNGGLPPTAAMVAAWHPDPPAQAVLWALSHHFLPEAWLKGFLWIYACSFLRLAFLLNVVHPMGVWYYFPLAVLFKTPVAALVLMVLAAITGVWLFTRRRRSLEAWWTVACLFVPPVIYFASAMRSNMNIGVRHVLPTYAFAYVACGVVAAHALRRWRRPVRLALAGLALALISETVAAAPDYIAFFNAAAGGPANGINLLGDSNLDWGQDLPALAAWQRKNPEVHLYLSYFGTVDPAYYGIKYHALPGNYLFGPPVDEKPLEHPAVLAISAIHLQGMSVSNAVGERYSGLRAERPREILGHTIYLYDAPDPSAR